MVNVYTQAKDLSHLMDYFCRTEDARELCVRRRDSDIEIWLQQDGESQNVIPPWYTPKIRREQGFTTEYFQDLRAAVERAGWQTKERIPVITAAVTEIFAPTLRFIKVLVGSDSLMFQPLGYVVAEEQHLIRKPLHLLNQQQVYPR